MNIPSFLSLKIGEIILMSICERSIIGIRRNTQTSVILGQKVLIPKPIVGYERGGLRSDTVKSVSRQGTPYKAKPFKVTTHSPVTMLAALKIENTVQLMIEEGVVAQLRES